MSDWIGEVHFLRLPISLPCPVPVVPGTPDTMRDGEAIPMEERTELCAVDAYWTIGAQVLCDIHLRVACDVLGLDYDDLLDEAAGNPAYDRPAGEIRDYWRERETVPWADRHRYSQEDAARTQGTPA